MLGNSPIRHLQQKKRHGKIDDNGRERKKEIDSCMLPFFILELKQRKSVFQQPKESNTAC